RLTFLECMRAQSFPDDYIFCGTIAERYKQVGQAVPPLMMKKVQEGLKRT
ncbi:DNA cytosine methyltransferase, partial [Patescibacteria group bacterium]|nr:DNA cytosine methyltransferase [Patescibacteria group bacterium]